MDHTVVEIDDSERPMSERIILAVAEAEGRSPTNLRTPLYQAIDPDALNRLFDPEENGPGDIPLMVEFRYHEYTIRARRTRISISEQEDA